MNFIKKNLLEKNLFYDGTLILKYHIEYPTIISTNSQDGNIRFNLYNKNLAFQLKEKSENELYQEAIETYLYNKKNGYPIMVYEIDRVLEITHNDYHIISLYIDEYLFTGGAHGNTLRSSQTWNLFQDFMIPLEDFFPKNPYFMIDILKKINQQIAKDPEIYFNNSCQLVLDNFQPQNYYIAKNQIVIYFQQYEIAPYSSGIRTFVV